jgi:ubiquinone/menaquinone biosynthesis C-methylase UbiE
MQGESMSKQSPQYDGFEYERYRASYPKDVATKLFSLTNYQPPQKILEIGCGTGKGTEILIDQGALVHAVEPNSSMGKIAEQKFSPKKFSWTECTFESYPEPEGRFPLITSAHAFHWVDQEIAFSKAHKLLEPGGALAIYRNNRKHDDEFSRREHQIHVQLNGADPHGSWNENYYEALAECVTEFIGHSKGRFYRPQVYEFEHTVRYTTEDYLGLQNTFWSDPKENWQQVQDKIAEIIESMGGSIVYPYTTILYVLMRK